MGDGQLAWDTGHDTAQYRCTVYDSTTLNSAFGVYDFSVERFCSERACAMIEVECSNATQCLDMRALHFCDEVTAKFSESNRFFVLPFSEKEFLPWRRILPLFVTFFSTLFGKCHEAVQVSAAIASDRLHLDAVRPEIEFISDFLNIN